MITESEGLVSCADASYPATAAKCGGGKGTWNSDGVSLSRSTVQSQNGQEVTQTDTFTSTDGQAHGLDLEYDNFTGTGIFSSPVWLLPGSSGYATYSPGDTAALSGGSTNAIFAQDGVLGGNALESPAALVYNTQPDSVRFTGASEIHLNYRRTVPPGGSLTISHTYVDASDAATTTALANAVIDQTVRPTVAFTAPNPGTVLSTASVQLYGTASAHDGLSLKVGGAAVAVNPDGTWSTDVSLNPGSNTITATASDGAGNLAQASDTVIYKLTPASHLLRRSEGGQEHPAQGQGRAAQEPLPRGQDPPSALADVSLGTGRARLLLGGCGVARRRQGWADRIDRQGQGQASHPAAPGHAPQLAAPGRQDRLQACDLLLRRLRKALPGNPHRRQTGGEQIRIPVAVTLERRFALMEGPAVELDDRAALRQTGRPPHSRRSRR